MSINNLKKLARHAAKHCIGMEGNISGKIDKNLLYIKASGTRLETLEGEDLIPFNFNGKQLGLFGKKGSMELSFHTYLLGFDKIWYISHTHPVNTLKILCTDNSKIFADFRLFPDQVVFNGPKSCLVPYGKPGEELTSLIKQNVEEFIKTEGYFPKLILLENHGVIACGETIKECIIATDICEKAAEVFVGGLSIGGMKFLTDDEKMALVNDNKEQYRINQLK